MDWDAAIEKNREALKRVLAMLVAMAGLEGAVFTSPLWGGRREASGGGHDLDLKGTPTRQSDDCRPPHKGEVGSAFTLPRYLRFAVLRLLRPAEAAARRLIIVAARGVSSRFAEGKSVVPVARWKAGERRVGAEHRAPGRKGARREDGSQVRLGFPLFDPAYRFRRRRPARNGVPRISFPGFSEPFPILPPPSPDDPVDAERLALRLAALGRVLDDLPRAARRFARWRACRDAQIKDCRSAGRIRRLSPLRPGRPPGCRPVHGGRPWHEVDDILATVHGLAFWALEAPDTS